MAAKYAINLKDGTLVYRSKATDAMPVLFRWIPDEVAKGIMEKRIDPNKVVNIIMKKVFSADNFDHSEYEAELKKLNVVFKEEEVPEPEEVVDTTTDDIADSVTLDELGMGGQKTAGNKSGNKGAGNKSGNKGAGKQTPENDAGASEKDGVLAGESASANADGEEELDI